jgi:hypothetical protein
VLLIIVYEYCRVLILNKVVGKKAVCMLVTYSLCLICGDHDEQHDRRDQHYQRVSSTITPRSHSSSLSILPIWLGLLLCQTISIAYHMNGRSDTKQGSSDSKQKLHVIYKDYENNKYTRHQSNAKDIKDMKHQTQPSFQIQGPGNWQPPAIHHRASWRFPHPQPFS